MSATDCPPFLKPRLRLFLSADIVGSTSLKQTRARVAGSTDDSTKGPIWFSAIQGFYFEAAQAFLHEWFDRQTKSSDRPYLYGEPPEFWKSIGDEVLFTKVLSDHRQLATTLSCWFEAVRRMRQFLKTENSSLDVKCTAWLAGFPYRNREVAISKSLTVDGKRTENYYKESGDLLNSFYSKGSSSTDVSVDYIGPSIDTGFRLTGFSSSRKMVLSVDAAYLISMTSFDGEVERIDLHYDGSHPLKGVMSGAPYPIFWINMSGESSLVVREDKLRSQTICNKEDVKEYCDAFYEEYSAFTFRPFIKGDVGQTMAKTPDWYENYHSLLVKNFNLADNEYDSTTDEAETANGEDVSQREIESFATEIKLAPPDTNQNFVVGNRVSHSKFGKGTIVSVNGRRLDINFDNVGVRRVLDLFIKLV